MNKLLLIIGFIVMLLAQWLVPGQMIYEQERVLIEGTPYKFRTQPIDPSDPFRGKYIVLNYEMNEVKKPEHQLKWGEDLYVYIEKDSAGFAKATHASATRLETQQDFVLATAGYARDSTIFFSLPFNVFYMEESKALDAEIAVRTLNRDSLPNNCYGVVYVKGKQAVLNDVLVNDISIQDYVAKD